MVVFPTSAYNIGRRGSKSMTGQRFVIIEVAALPFYNKPEC